MCFSRSLRCWQAPPLRSQARVSLLAVTQQQYTDASACFGFLWLPCHQLRKCTAFTGSCNETRPPWTNNTIPGEYAHQMYGLWGRGCDVAGENVRNSHKHRLPLREHAFSLTYNFVTEETATCTALTVITCDDHVLGLERRWRHRLAGTGHHVTRCMGQHTPT